MQATKSTPATEGRRRPGSRHAAAPRPDNARADEVPAKNPAWHASITKMGLASAVLLWLALPPVDWGWLGWFAPIGWLLLIRTNTLAGRRPYWKLYAVGWAYFGVAFYWITLPHASAILG